MKSESVIRKNIDITRENRLDTVEQNGECQEGGEFVYFSKDRFTVSKYIADLIVKHHVGTCGTKVPH